MTTVSKEQFLRDYSNKVTDGNAALFVGAGLSRPAGFVDWKGLLRGIAKDLGLDVDLESDLVAIAQYHQNEYGSRARLNEKLIEEFTKGAKATESHSLIARLPIDTVWTTNYDTLLEEAYRGENKRVDVKTTQANVSQTHAGVDVTIFKMHGDVSQPHEAVLTKDDYEMYGLKRELFTIRLKGDLVSRTFLFLGFSFTDPNIDYILSRLKPLLGQSTPLHYCIIKRPDMPANPSAKQKADYEYELRKLALRIGDLKRFGIQTVLIDSYGEITEILRELNRRAFFGHIFVSGSAAEGTDSFSFERLKVFAREVGREIIVRGYNLVSGYGAGIGSEILIGAIEGGQLSPSAMRERLILRPFPRSVEQTRKKEVYREWRKAMVSMTGFSIFLAGNKSLAQGAPAVLGDGMREEFEVGTEPPAYSCPIPVGASGYVAREIWDKVRADPRRYYRGVDVVRELEILNDPARSDKELINAIFEIIEKVRSGGD
jgi:hypothetical protein